MAVWTLEWTRRTSGAQETRTFAGWGLEGPKIRYVSQDADVATFKYIGTWEGANGLFQYGDPVRILKDGAAWWTGTIVRRPLAAMPASEEMLFEARGPWLYLEEHEFQVPWQSWHTQVPEAIFNTHIIYNTSDGVTLVSTRTTMMYVLDYLLSQYAGVAAASRPFQYAAEDILPGVELFVPAHEARDLTCAGALKMLLRWHRDAVVWFDYSQTPPALHIGRQVGLEEVSLALPRAGANGAVQEFELQPREDLRRPSVVIRYERRNTVNGEGKLAISVDAYPPGSTGREFGAWTMSVDLLGFNKTTVRASLLCRTKNYFDTGWWMNHEPKLSGDNIANVTIEGVKVLTPLQFVTGSSPLIEVSAIPGAPLLERELVEGSIAPWMELEDGSEVEWRHEVMTAKASFDHYSGPVGNAGSILIGRVTMDVSARVIATNAPNGESSYEATESIEGGDPQPVGLAQYLYEQVSGLEYSGAVSLVEEEVGGQVRIGKALNLTGGEAAWAGMRAMVQGVVEEIETGTTLIEVGPPDVLGAQDLVELLKVGRTRARWTNPRVAEDGELLDDLTLGKVGPNNESGLGPTHGQYLVLTPDAATTEVAGQQRYDHVAIDGRGTAIAAARKDKPGRFLITLGTGPQGSPPNELPKLILSADAENAAADLGSVVIDLAALVNVPAAARVITLREVCVKVGTAERKMIVLGGEPY